MKKLVDFRLSRQELRLILGGASSYADCAGGGKVECSGGSSCTSQSANSAGDGWCQCGDNPIKRCAIM